MDNGLAATFNPAAEHFRALAEYSPDSIVRFDQELRQVYINPAGLQWYGKPATLVSGKTLGEAGVPEPQCRVWTEQIRQVFATGESLKTEGSFPSGVEVRFYQTRYVAEYGADGTVASVLAISRDVTEQKQAAEALRQNEKINKEILDALPANVVVIDGQGAIVAVNQSWLRFAAEHDAPESSRIGVGANYLEACHRAQGDLLAPVALDGIEAVLSGRREKFTHEYRCDSPTQSRWFLMQVVPACGALTGAIITHFDISARKQSETAIVHAKRDWERTFDTVPDLIMLLDRDFRITRANRAQADRLGVTPAELIGKRCSSVIHGTDNPPDNCPHHLLLHDGQEQFVEVSLPSLHGYFHVSVTPLYDDAGKLIGSVHVSRDITDRRKLEQALALSHSHTQTILDNLPMLAWLKDRDGRFLMVNRHFAEGVGRPLEEILGLTAFDVWPHDLAKEYQAISVRCANT